MNDNQLICLVCESQDITKFWAIPGYRLARCGECDFVWDYFPPENLLTQYDKSYFNNDNPKGGYANYFEGMILNRKTFSDRLKKIENRFGKGKLMDVGCALGDFLIEAKKLGWENVEGLEVSDYAYQFAKKRGLKVFKGNLMEQKFKEKSFDIITYQDVIEHLTNPLAELTKIFKILKPKGVIYLVTPDVGGFWAKLLGPLWYHYKPVEHVNYFSQKTIKKLLKKAGFENIQTQKTYHVLSLEYIVNRLRYYLPFIFEFTLRIVKKIPLKRITFKLYTGELEAWGQKP